MSMSDAYTECENRGIPTNAPDALAQLWAKLSLAERAEIFPFASNYGAATPGAMKVGGWVLSQPEAGQWRMWNGTSNLVFQVGAPRARGEYKIRYTSGEEAFSGHRELYEASHVVMAPADNASSGAPLPAKDLAALNLAHAASRLLLTLDPNHVHRDTVRNALEAYQAAPKSLPVRARPIFPPAANAARARELAAEHIRRARILSTRDVPRTGRPWQPGDPSRLNMMHEAADTLAKLCAVHLGAGPAHEDEARAYALAFQLVEASARRLAMRRLR